MEITEQCVVALTWTLKDTLGEVLDVLDDPVEFLIGGHDLLPAIEQHVQDSVAQVYLLTGIGEVYPFLRSHTVLNNLHRLVAKAPLVAFFPGTYSGRQLKLFGLLTDDNYYRAFNLDTFTNSSI